MIHLEYAHRFEHSAEDVWSILGDFGNAEMAEGFVERVEVIGQGVGMERIFHLAPHLGGGSVRERLEAYDPVLRQMSYRITDNGPLPFTGYFGTLTVTPCGPRACALLVELRLVPVTARPEECQAISIGNMTMLYTNIDRILNDRKTKEPSHG